MLKVIAFYDKFSNDQFSGPLEGQRDFFKDSKEITAKIFESKDIKEVLIVSEIQLPEEVKVEFKEKRAYCDQEKNEKKSLNTTIPVFKYEKNGKHLIQQPSRTSCWLTCINMLLCDMGKFELYQKAAEARWAKDQQIASRIKKLGFECIDQPLTFNDENMVQVIADDLKKNGSAILGLETHGHVVLLDSITTEYALIRDSWNGIYIKLSIEGFKKAIGFKNEIKRMQIKDPKKNVLDLKELIIQHLELFTETEELRNIAKKVLHGDSVTDVEIGLAISVLSKKP
tara:strand:- start:249 stop:1100 length:852 start_codon:yes stop_codon:yes gene_type:complete